MQQTLKEYMIQQEKDSNIKKIFAFFMNEKDVDEEKVKSFVNKNEMSMKEFNEFTYHILSSFCSSGEYNRKERPKVDENQVILGIEVEYEHTDNPLIAEKIALDHLSEDGGQQYYDYLLLMERLMEEKVPLEKIENLLKG